MLDGRRYRALARSEGKDARSSGPLLREAGIGAFIFLFGWHWPDARCGLFYVAELNLRRLSATRGLAQFDGHAPNSFKLLENAVRNCNIIDFPFQISVSSCHL